jgi:hypothetical protein
MALYTVFTKIYVFYIQGITKIKQSYYFIVTSLSSTSISCFCQHLLIM